MADKTEQSEAQRKAEKRAALVAEYRARYGEAGRDEAAVARAFGYEEDPPDLTEVKVDPDAAKAPNIGHK